MSSHSRKSLVCQDYGATLSQGRCEQKKHICDLKLSTQAKKAGLPIPKILGLSASLVLQAVKVSYLCQIYPNFNLPPLQLDQFRSEKARLEQILDAEVETAEELSLAKYVNSANEEVVIVPRGNVPSINAEVLRQADEAQKQLRLIRMNAEIAINAAG